jgi:3-phenylpropionate/trans-cinnamate dioxygenase ferredoxin reductase subunit
MKTTHIIIGAGQAGGWAATAMRQAGFTGRILLLGDEAWRPYERPPLSKAWLTEAEPPAVQYFHKPDRYAELDIDFRPSTPAIAIDPIGQRVRLADDSVAAYDKLLFTTGGRARKLGVPGAEHVLTLRTIEDSLAIRARLATAQRVICIGAGVIGLEIAASARKLGRDVTVLEAGPSAMGRSVAPEIATFVTELHRQAGSRLHFNMAVQAIDTAPDGTMSVFCANGFGVTGDLVLAGVGMERNLDLARQTGVAIEGGIVVDEFGQSSVANIYAAGDVAAFFHPLFGRHLRLEAWRHAQNHGVAVGQAMAGVMKPYDDVPWFWTDQHDVNLQVAGMAVEATRTILRPGADKHEFTAVHLLDDNRVIAVTTANAPRDIRAGTAMIKSAKPIDPEAIANPAIALQSLVPK